LFGFPKLSSLLPLFFLGFFSATAAAQDPPSEESIKFFRTNCASCHTIGGGRLTGPDLKDLSKRAERDWLVEFMKDPKATLDAGDPYGQKILSEARGVYMPPVPGMTEELANKLLDLIDTESALEKSKFSGVQISERPLTDLDIERGEALFNGQQALMEGGPACISCHYLSGLSGLGGGRLGPDLSSAYSRLEGRKALGAWLSSPPSVVMQPLYVDAPLDSEEVLALIAYLKATAGQGELEAESTSLEFTLAGIALAAGLMVLFDLLWRKRFRSVRRTLLATR
jgi:mono/diheme cytochrome c family protein